MTPTSGGTGAPRPDSSRTALQRFLGLFKRERLRGLFTLERFLGLFTEVRGGEGATALLLTLNVYVLLTTYYIIKPVREALILAGRDVGSSSSWLGKLLGVFARGGPEAKAYSAVLTALLLLLVVPGY